MPKLSLHCKFQSSVNRTFRVIGIIGGFEIEDSWYIQEYHEVKHDGKLFAEPFDAPFVRTCKEMDYAIMQGKIIVL